MSRYVIADNISGVVCTVVTAPDPVSACRLFDASLGSLGKTYEEHAPRSRSAHATYAVYIAPDDTPESPAAHGVTAELVSRLVKIAVVVVRQP